MFRKGQVYKYPSGTTITIVKGGSDRVNGMLKIKFSDKHKEQECSVDFMARQLQNNFVEKVKTTKNGKRK